MNKLERKKKRIIRTRSRIKGTGAMPRLSIYRSNKHVYVQLIDDEKRKTIVGFSEKHIPNEGKDEKEKMKKAQALGKYLALEAKKKKITKAVFDRGAYAYHGIVKALPEGAREEGLKI